MTLTTSHPDFNEARAKAFAWAVSAGYLTNRQIDECVAAGEAGLKNERLREQVGEEKAA